MPKLPIANLSVGQVVQSEVYDRNGRLLIPKDTILKENHLKALRTWGIQAVVVTGDASTMDSPTENLVVSEKNQDKIEKDLAKRFSQTDLQHPFMQELYKICYERALIRASRTGAKS